MNFHNLIRDLKQKAYRYKKKHPNYEKHEKYWNILQDVGAVERTLKILNKKYKD